MLVTLPVIYIPVVPARKSLNDRLQVSAKRGVRKIVFFDELVVILDAPINPCRSGRSSRSGPRLSTMRIIGTHLLEHDAQRCLTDPLSMLALLWHCSQGWASTHALV